MENYLSIILGGGKGSRLYPLTADRAKPACPFGGKYRLVDIPISNCINSGLRRIYILTQFSSASLHLHIGRTYNFDHFNENFCEILAAEQTRHNEDWYSGTADAVRKNLSHFRVHHPSHYIILSGDQLYCMNLGAYIERHKESGAEVSIASTPVTRSEADELGILRVDSKGYIDAFLEKPGADTNIDEYRMPESQKTDKDKQEQKEFLASMGIYIFNAEALERVLSGDEKDFGKEIIPKTIGKINVASYIYRDYWEDIGTIKNFYDANLNLTSPYPRFNLYDSLNPLYTHRRNLPPTKINASTLKNSISSEGSIINDSRINQSLIGIRSIIEKGCSLEGVYMMGADFYETEQEKKNNQEKKIPDYGIGKGSLIRHAIIDKNVRIGKECQLGVDNRERPDYDHPDYSIREGIIIIRKGATIPDGTIL